MLSTATTSLKRGKRTLAVAAIGVVGLLSIGACSAASPQQTTHVYAASDGINGNVAGVELRNVMVVSNGANDQGRLLGTFINSTANAVTVSVEGKSNTLTVNVPANGEKALDLNAEEKIFATTGVPAGALLDTKFTVGGSSQSFKLPVLDGTLTEYKAYLPTPSVAPTSTPTQGPSGEPTSTETSSSGH